MRALVLLGMIGVAHPAIAQSGRALDSVTVATYRQVLIGLRDTIDLVSARSVEFRRDLRTIGAGTVLARSQRLTASCRSVRDALRDARPTLAGLPIEDRSRLLRDSVLVAMDGLRRRLDIECVRGLGQDGPGERADTLRAWGPYRTSRVSDAVTAYHGAAARLARRLGIDLSRN